MSGQVYFVTLYFEKEYITTNEAVIGHEDEGKDGGGGLACCDGISFAPTLLGNDAKQQTHDFLYWEFHETDQIGLRMGDWKLVVIKGVPHLYDLRQDIHEDHDIASSHQEVVRRMVDIIHREHRPSELFPVTLPPKQK